MKPGLSRSLSSHETLHQSFLVFHNYSRLGLCALITACRAISPETTTLHNTLSAQEKADGWCLLWDGKTTTGWRSARSDYFPTNSWRISDGELGVVSSGNGEAQAGGDIISRERYSNFELTVSFKTAAGCNSGIKIFVQPNLDPVTGQGGKASTGSAIGLEYQILDDERHPDAKLGHDGNRKPGALYDLIPTVRLELAMSQRGSELNETFYFPGGGQNLTCLSKIELNCAKGLFD
jgi:Domain of Unknown Function (DUF1080)